MDARLTPAGPTEVCVVCSRALRARYYENAVRERFCTRHEADGRCTLCALPTGAPHVPASSSAYCGRCSTELVETQAGVKAVLPTVKAELLRLSVVLRLPVQVLLVPLRELQVSSTRTARTCGLTISTGDRVVEIRVASGMPRLQFGAVVAHEATHAYLVQARAPALDQRVEEGVCQLVSYAWLARHQHRTAELLKHAIATDPDPVYGAGFREARLAARRAGLPRVLSHVVVTGSLP